MSKLNLNVRRKSSGNVRNMLSGNAGDEYSNNERAGSCILIVKCQGPNGSDMKIIQSFQSRNPGHEKTDMNKKVHKSEQGSNESDTNANVNTSEKKKETGDNEVYNAYSRLILKEVIPRVQECVPDGSWVTPRMTHDWVSLIKGKDNSKNNQSSSEDKTSKVESSSDPLVATFLPPDQDDNDQVKKSEKNEKSTKTSPADILKEVKGSADVLYLHPRAKGVGATSFFILYTKGGENYDLQPNNPSMASLSISESPHNKRRTTISNNNNNNDNSTKILKRQRIYGLARRSLHDSCVVILLTSIPAFGILRHHFDAVTSAFFDRGNFESDKGEDFITFLNTITHPQNGLLLRSNPSSLNQLWGDLPIMWLLKRFGVDRILGLVKLLLLEGRILIFSSSAAKSSTAVLGLLSLIPGSYTQALNYYDSEQFQSQSSRLKNFGLPLKIFRDGEYVVHPNLSLRAASAEYVFDKFRGFLCGTNNAMVGKLSSSKLDAIVDLDSNSIETQNFSIDPVTGEQTNVNKVSLSFEFGQNEATFIDDIYDSLPSQNNPLYEDPFGQSNFGDEDFDDFDLDYSPTTRTDPYADTIDNLTSEWDGSDSWIRRHFQHYIEKLLFDASSALAECRRVYSGNAPQKGDHTSSTGEQKQLSVTIPKPPQSQSWFSRMVSPNKTFEEMLDNYNSSWIEAWMETKNFKEWTKDHSYHDMTKKKEEPIVINLNSSKSNSSGTISPSSPTSSLSPNAGKSQRASWFSREQVNQNTTETKKKTKHLYAPDPLPQSGIFHYTYENGDTYHGDFSGRKRHGFGTYVEHATGNTYEGDWSYDVREGSGILTTGAGDFLYDGEWKNDKRNGEGHCTIRGRETYTGSWLDNKFHYHGVYCESDGSVYDGNWKQGRKEGHGTLTKANGDCYVGDFKGGLFHGFGKYSTAGGVDEQRVNRGTVYIGNYKEGKRDGEGTFMDNRPVVRGTDQLSISKSEYLHFKSQSFSLAEGPVKGEEGNESQSNIDDIIDEKVIEEVSNDEEQTDLSKGNDTVDSVDSDSVDQARRKEGQGMRKYDGLWCQDMKHGFGMYTNEFGDVKEGEWSMDFPKNGEWKIGYRNGDQYLGICKDGRPHGEGVCKFSNQDVYTGEWCNGLREGKGTCIYSSGDSYEGLWSCNQPLYISSETLNNNSKSNDSSQDPTSSSSQVKRSEKGHSFEVPYLIETQIPPRLDGNHRSSADIFSPTSYPPTPKLADKPLSSMNGPSSIIYPSSGDKYIGQLIEGKRHGSGVYYEKITGNTYDGEWKDDLRHGKGTLTSGAKDFTYIGDWVNDKRTGKGVCYVRNTQTYDGEWRDNQFHGMGKYFDSNGGTYEGEWVCGVKEGQGKYVYAPIEVTDVTNDTEDNAREVYKGAWKGGIRDGIGEMTYFDGSVYNGEWQNDKRNGEGKLISLSGDSHEGLWVDDLRHGWGIWTSPQGDVVEGEWIYDDPKDGEWKIVYSNNDQFVGRCVDGRPNGFGVCKYGNGSVYTGDWLDGCRHGKGVCVFVNGEVYDGEWENDHVSLRGTGKLTFQDGREQNF